MRYLVENPKAGFSGLAPRLLRIPLGRLAQRENQRQSKEVDVKAGD